MVTAFTSIKGAWSPRLLNPALWIEARHQDAFFQAIAGTTAVTDGSVAGYAKDLSGNGFDLSSTADSSVRPNWVFNNGFPYLDFDSAGASNSNLQRTSSLGLYAAGKFTVFAALRGNPSAAADVVVGEGRSSSTTPALLCRTDVTTTSTSAIFVRTDAASTIANAALNTSAFDNTDRVVGWVWDGTNIFGYNNLTRSAGVSLAAGSTITIDRFCVGASENTGISGNFEMRLYALVIVKDVLGYPTIRRLAKYLGARMGVNVV